MKVAIGPVFDEFGGVSQHIFAIKKFSSHRVSIVPAKLARTVFGRTAVTRRLYQKCMKKPHLAGYDVVHSHVDPWFTNLCRLSRTNTCKWVHTYHTLYFKEDYPKGLQTWQKAINSALIEVACKADVRISISEWLHDYLSDKYSIQTKIIPNGVDLEVCNKANPGRFVKKYGIRDFVLFVGNIQPVKNPELFVDLAARMPEVSFVMIGTNLDANRLMKQYGVSVPKNLVLMGQIRHENALDAVSACKAFVMTSKREGIPTALLEAMAMGKPAVAPSHSGCKEVIQSNDFGFLYEPDSLDDLVEQVKQALVSEHVGERARERVLQNYNWKVVAKKIDALYESPR